VQRRRARAGPLAQATADRRREAVIARSAT
jgi:hypothetical protein